MSVGRAREATCREGGDEEVGEKGSEVSEVSGGAGAKSHVDSG